MEALGDDESSRGQEYERVRTRLVSFFSWKGCPDADDLADEALMRVGRKLAEGETLEQSVAHYALGVARFVYLEDVKAGVKAREAMAQAPAVQDEDEVHHERLHALDDCMKSLGTENANLVRRYYEEPKGQKKIEARKNLAKEQGLSMNALRLRTLKLRKSLAECVEKKIAA